MKNIYNFFKTDKEIILYLIVGVLTTMVNILVYYIFTRIINFSPYISNIIAWIVAVIFAFFTNKFIVFKSLNKSISNILKEGVSFVSLRIISLGFDMLIMYIIISVLNYNDLIGKLISQIIVTLSNYIFSKMFIFKTKKAE